MNLDFKFNLTYAFLYSVLLRAFCEFVWHSMGIFDIIVIYATHMVIPFPWPTSYGDPNARITAITHHPSSIQYKYAYNGFRMKVNGATTTKQLVPQWSSKMTCIWKTTLPLLLVATLVDYVKMQVRLFILMQKLTKRMLYTSTLIRL
jgi:hypothetical protein